MNRAFFRNLFESLFLSQGLLMEPLNIKSNLLSLSTTNRIGEATTRFLSPQLPRLVSRTLIPFLN